MKASPKISIIVPVYNTEKYLKRCLGSIMNQTYRNLEIICINDGSTDSSAKILESYAKQDKRIKIITQRNQGLSATRNSGLKKVTGDYLTFVDSDDKVRPNFIRELLVPYERDQNNVLSVCGFLRKFLKTNQTEEMFLTPPSLRKNTDTKKSYILRLLTLDGRLYSVDNKLFIAKVAKNLYFDQSLTFAEDTKFVLDYLEILDGNISFILKPLYIYNFGSENSIVNQSSLSWQNWRKSYNNLRNWVGKNPQLKEKFWLKVILLRWRISYLRSKSRAKKTL